MEEKKNRYKKYIDSEEFKALKVELIISRGCKCERCGKTRTPKSLQLHHITYERLFDELPTDLLLLCGICHMKAHGLIKEKPPKVHKKKTAKAKKKSPFQMTRKDKALQKRYDKHRHV